MILCVEKKLIGEHLDEILNRGKDGVMGVACFEVGVACLQALIACLKPADGKSLPCSTASLFASKRDRVLCARPLGSS